MKNKFLRQLLLWLVIFMLAVILANHMSKKAGVESLTYSQFKSLLKQGKVMELSIGSEEIKGKYENEEGKEVNFKTVLVEDPKLIEELEEKGVKYAGEKEKSNWLNFLYAFGPVVLIIFIWILRILLRILFGL